MNKIKNIVQWFKEEQKQSTLHEKIVPLDQSKEWEIGNQGSLARKDKHYFDVVIVRYGKNPQEQFENAMIRSCSLEKLEGRQIHGLVLLAEYQGKFLVQAKAEAGNTTPGHIVLTTTIQSNYENIHKYPILYKELLQQKPVLQAAAPQDAGMLYGKHNEYRFVRLKKSIELSPHFYWATLDEIRELQKLNLVGDHLTQMIGHITISGVLK